MKRQRIRQFTMLVSLLLFPVPLYQTRRGISVTEPIGYIVLYSFCGLMVFLALTAGKRAFCYYVCWMAPFMVAGSKIRLSLGLPALRLQAKPDNCARCGRCTRNCPMSLDVQSMVQSGAVRYVFGMLLAAGRGH